jgi:pyrroloquinoline quinone (PQQ) biosynthesis protein C
MAIAAIAPMFASLLQPRWVRSLDDTPLLARCRAGAATRAELRSFVCQQRHYSRHFTRYVAALMASLTDEEDRRALTSNLFEEMGLAGHGSVPHAELYRDMMRTMGIGLDEEAPSPATQELVRTMLECCTSARPMVGLGALCLGAEAIVPHVYSTIVAGFTAIGEPRERLAFFLLHIDEDDKHAETMFAILHRHLKDDPDSRLDLEYGAGRAIAARTAFFSAIVDGHGHGHGHGHGQRNARSAA